MRIIKPGIGQEKILLFSPRWTGEGCSQAKFLNDRSTKCRPLLFFKCNSWRWRRGNQIQPLVICMRPPIMKEAAQSKPGIFTLKDLCSSIKRPAIARFACYPFLVAFFKFPRHVQQVGGYSAYFWQSVYHPRSRKITTESAIPSTEPATTWAGVWRRRTTRDQLTRTSKAKLGSMMAP